MEFALSAITGDLCSRFITYLVNKCTDRWSSEEKLQRLQLLLVRLHIVVEEAEGRYITNSQMLLQLRTITQAMYRGYSALEEFRSSQQIQAQRQVNRAHLGMQRSRDFSQLSQSKIRRQVSISNPWLLITLGRQSRCTIPPCRLKSSNGLVCEFLLIIYFLQKESCVHKSEPNPRNTQMQKGISIENEYV